MRTVVYVDDYGDKHIIEVDPLDEIFLRSRFTIISCESA
jgi:hypothetical protein